MVSLQRVTIDVRQVQGEKIVLRDEQGHYLRRVLRLESGDRFIAMDGVGKWWLAQLTGDEAQILEPLEVRTELPVSVTLIIALPKGNGFDDVVRSCTELGVSCITPVLSERTLLNPSPQKLERWRRIATEAAEQSERAFVPTVLEPVSFNMAISEAGANHRFLCEARGEIPHFSQKVNSLSGEIIIATGPEGGWTPTEIETARNHGFQPVSLGKRILRAVTAPIVALSLAAASLENV
ncbi:MAG TPA: 16S rRNA (uracil(1498)-N(3))-methyltransferase [Nostocaceae cyanobacterium]|nr:16S rRNA (uracil(1498)-N(3))-methyltransferase [Nostocaceae cyanobacterium]